MQYTGYLFIGIGANGNFYTLRETYLHTWYANGVAHYEVRSYHHFNLSQNADDALAKASEYSLNMGIQLRADRDTMEAELHEIKRANADQLRERAEREAAWEVARQDMRARQLQEMQDQILVQGVYPCGPHRGLGFAAAPRDYTTWIASMADKFERESPMRLVAETIITKYSHLILPSPGPGLVAGIPGERMDFIATVVRKTHFDGAYGRTYIVTLVTNDGVCLVSKSGRFSPKIGAELAFKATIKEHSEYRGQCQTVIQRVALIEAKKKAA